MINGANSAKSSGCTFSAASAAGGDGCSPVCGWGAALARPALVPLVAGGGAGGGADTEMPSV